MNMMNKCNSVLLFLELPYIEWILFRKAHFWESGSVKRILIGEIFLKGLLKAYSPFLLDFLSSLCFTTEFWKTLNILSVTD